MLEYKRVPFEIKNLVDASGGGWEISGYASTFNDAEPDAYGDIVAPGAFSASIAERPTKFLYEHQTPIGKQLEIREDAHGLFGRWSIVDTTIGTDAHKLAQAGVLDSLSIGYVTVAAEVRDDGVRVIKAADLFEVSCVALPANSNALITDVKHARRQRKYMGGMTGEEPPEGSYEALSEDIGEAIEDALSPTVPGMGGAGMDQRPWVCIIATYLTHAVAMVMTPDGESTYYDYPYVASADGETITLGAPTEVEAETTFSPVKGLGLPYGLHAARVESAVRELRLRTKAGMARGAKEGRQIREARRQQLATIRDGLRAHADELHAIYEETAPTKALNLSQELRRRRLARHGIELEFVS
jgi:HK97 family phage prohead protease